MNTTQFCLNFLIARMISLKMQAKRAETRRQKSRGPWSLESDRDGRSEQAVVEAAAKYGPAAIAALPQHMTKLRLIMTASICLFPPICRMRV
jgi:hypothetical protein